MFAERPYLMPEDEDELAQKLGLSTRNIRVRIIYSCDHFVRFRSFQNIVVKNNGESKVSILK